MKNRTFSKILSVFLTVAMLSGIAPLNGFTDLKLPDLFSISASAETYGGSCGENVNWSLDTETGVLDITGTGAMENYWSPSGLPWRDYRLSVKTVNIEKGVTSIGYWTFAFCENLTSITIPESVTSVGHHAFYNCHSLTSITIPEGVTSIDSQTFCDCYSLASITIPEGVTSIGDFAFCGCNSLTAVTIPEGVTSIGDSAFHDCNSLTSITIPEGVTSIDDGAFEGCGSLTSVTIPASVTSIGQWAFYNCDSLTGITVDPDNVDYSSDEYGVLYNGDKTTLIQYPDDNGRETFEIPETVTSISRDAFAYCGYIKSVSIPEGVTNIDDQVFFYCSSLTTIKIPVSVISIGYSAFSGCGNLTDIYYTGTEDEWKQISIDSFNEDLIYAAIHLKITLTLTDSYGNVVSEKVIDGDLGEYTFEGIEDGEYKVTVSQPFHAAKEYDVVASDGKATCRFSLNPLGDIDGNGKINITDYTAVLKHVKKTSSVEGYAFNCADVTGDGKVTVLDYSAILRHVKKKNPLWKI